MCFLHYYIFKIGTVCMSTIGQDNNKEFTTHSHEAYIPFLVKVQLFPGTNGHTLQRVPCMVLVHFTGVSCGVDVQPVVNLTHACLRTKLFLTVQLRGVHPDTPTTRLYVHLI